MALYASLMKRVLDKDGPNGVVFSCFDHGGAGGGFENTWGTGKLFFTALQTPMVRIHNRPAYNSECHATREMGVGELNNLPGRGACRLVWSIGGNPYEAQTNYFLDHWVPNLNGATLEAKKKRFPGEPLIRRNDLRRSTAQRNGGHRRAGRRQGQRAAPRHPARHRYRALQHTVHLRCGKGLDRQEFIAQIHERGLTCRRRRIACL